MQKTRTDQVRALLKRIKTTIIIIIIITSIYWSFKL